ERIGEELWQLMLTGSTEPPPELATTRVRLILNEPPLRARMLRLLLDAQHDLAEALRAAYPDQLDEITSAAVVGAWLGAAQAGALVGIARGDDMERIWQNGMRAARIAMDGLDALPLPRRQEE